MAIIHNYPIKANVVSGDQLLITDSESEELETKQITIGDLPGASGDVASFSAGTTGLLPSNNTVGVVTLSGTLNVANGGTGKTTAQEAIDDLTAISAATVGHVLTKDSNGNAKWMASSGGVSTFTNTNGTFVSAGTENSTAAGAVTMGTIDLSATGLSSDVAVKQTQFLRGDNTWATQAGITPVGSDYYVQFKLNNGLSGSDEFTFSSKELSVENTVSIKGDGTNAGKLKIFCKDQTTPHAVTIEGPDHDAAVPYTLKLPKTLPNVANQILESNGSGALSWIATPSGGSVPLAANGVRGGVQLGYTTASKKYALELDNEKAFVDVPWSDTTYDVMGGGNSYAAGLVLAGSSTHGNSFLRKDGTWQTVSSGNDTNLATNNLTSTGNRTFASGNYNLKFTGSSSITMEQTNGLALTGPLSTNNQLYSIKNSIPNKNATFTIDWKDGNVQEVLLTHTSGNIVINCTTNVKSGARYSVIVKRNNSNGTFNFGSNVYWPDSSTSTPMGTAGSAYFQLYEFVAAGPGLMAYAYNDYATAG